MTNLSRVKTHAIDGGAVRFYHSDILLMKKAEIKEKTIKIGDFSLIVVWNW